MPYAPLTDQQLAEARDWAGKLGVPEQVVIDDAQGAKDRAYLDAALAHHGHEAGWTERMAGVGNQMMAGGGLGDGTQFETEADAATPFQNEAEAG